MRSTQALTYIPVARVQGADFALSSDRLAMMSDPKCFSREVT